MLRAKMRLLVLLGVGAALIGIAALINLLWQPFSWVLCLQTIIHFCIAGVLVVYALAAQATPTHHSRYRRSLGDLLSLRFGWMPWRFARLAYGLVVAGCLAGLGVVLLVLLG